MNGSVDERTARETAEQIASEFDRTVYVQNDFAASTEVVERISPALRRVWEKLEEFAAALPKFMKNKHRKHGV